MRSAQVTMKSIISFILAVLIGVIMYPFSFLKPFCDTDFPLEDSPFELTGTQDGVFEISGIKKPFNYYGLKYSCPGYMKGVFTYRIVRGKEISEEFFLEPGEGVTFYGFIDGCFENKKGIYPLNLCFTPLSGNCDNFEITSFSLFNRKIPDKEIFIQNEKLKAGVNLDWGGALSYLEDLDSEVETINADGKIIIDSKASEKYGGELLSSNVNLINCHDTGRLVQQSYYGALDDENYENGTFMGNRWSYNPVQGGNQFNGKSKIVDIKLTDDEIYIKARPMDWALDDSHITPSYMEAVYTLDGAKLNIKCRFVDFSGYSPRISTQELPAFYCAEPLNNFVYPGENGEIVSEPDLIFWPDAGYPNFKSSENWSAFISGENGFGIGLYTSHYDTFLAGVYDRGNCSGADPASEEPTSYIASVQPFEFMSFNPFEYEYSITTGSVDEIREIFS